MRIVKLQLKGFNRFALGDITTFTMTVDTPLQLILGTNGCGKSSLLSELTPLPAIPADYQKGGFKEIHIDYKDAKYVLRSDIGRGAKHSFLKDGQELNPGGTGMVQKDLVESELGYTNQLHQVLTGRLRFSEMSPIKRREWLSKISTTDFSYALSIFDQAKVLMRDNQGALKHTQEKLTQQQARMIDSDTLKDIERRAKACHDDIELLLNDRVRDTTSVPELREQIKSLLRDVKSKADYAMSFDLTPWQKKGFVDTYRFDQAIETINLDITRLQTALKIKGEEVLNNRQIVEQMMETGARSVPELEARLALAKENQASLVLPTDYPLDEVDIDHMIKDVTNVAVPLRDFCVDTPKDIKPPVDKESYNVNLQKVKEIKQQLNALHNRQDAAIKRIQYIESAKESKCPECGYTWREGVSDRELSNAKHALEQYGEQEAVLERNLHTVEALNQAYAEYISVMRRLRHIVDSYPRLDLLWKTVIEHKYYDTDPLMIMQQYSDFKFAVERKQQWLMLQEEIDQLQASLSKWKDGEGLSPLAFEQRIEKLENDAAQMTDKLRELDPQRKWLVRGRQQLLSYEETSSRVIESLTTIESLRDTLIESQRQEIIATTLQDRQADLSNLQTTLNQRDTLMQMINDLESTHGELESEREAWNDLINALSPTSGIIADQMTGFINSFLQQVNAIIARVWGHELEVMPCANEAGNLDYKFPLSVKNDAVRPKDISEASAGQREVVDFAFMITVMHYLDLHDYPMYLDETGATFDHHHRERLFNYIKLLVETGQSSQLFLVNHYASFSGGFSNAATCVLDTENVVLPSTYNEHVSFSASE